MVETIVTMVGAVALGLVATFALLGFLSSWLMNRDFLGDPLWWLEPEDEEIGIRMIAEDEAPDFLKVPLAEEIELFNNPDPGPYWSPWNENAGRKKR